MKNLAKILSLVLVALLFAGCASSRMVQVGNVHLRNKDGDEVRYYEKVTILDTTRIGDKVTSVRFVGSDNIEHYIPSGDITLDGLEYVQRRTTRSYIVVEPIYPYYWPYVVNYPYRPYYSRPWSSYRGGRPPMPRQHMPAPPRRPQPPTRPRNGRR